MGERKEDLYSNHVLVCRKFALILEWSILTEDINSARSSFYCSLNTDGNEYFWKALLKSFQSCTIAKE